jgi:hypothetical protein
MSTSDKLPPVKYRVGGVQPGPRVLPPTDVKRTATPVSAVPPPIQNTKEAPKDQ